MDAVLGGTLKVWPVEDVPNKGVLQNFAVKWPSEGRRRDDREGRQRGGGERVGVSGILGRRAPVVVTVLRESGRAQTDRGVSRRSAYVELGAPRWGVSCHRASSRTVTEVDRGRNVPPTPSAQTYVDIHRGSVVPSAARHGDDDESTRMVLVVARPQCVVASAGVGVVVGCARDRTSKEMVSPDRIEGSDLVANVAAAVSAAYAYNVLDVAVAVVANAAAAVTIAAVTTATATVNATVAATASPATANTAVFDDAIMTSLLAASQASSATRQRV
ncbi:uncharacterized protein LOC143188361 [Calliopsis andreniformis]|uniref:uncharacterized protein LOC143188361 n=1 Tax=Calliopsis andreniformis TaxID=337506 RepID=UPI003FCEDF55